MTHLSLFSGIGGIDLAAHWAGFRTIAFVERDEFCQKVLAKNFPGVPIYDDVTTFRGSGFTGTDIVSAGFPCQPHSLAGLRKASGDERDLWSEVVRILGEARPRWFLGENVPGLFSSESGRFFGRVVDELAALGYRVGWSCYGASDIGAVDRRHRVFIIAYSALLQDRGLQLGGLGADSVSNLGPDTTGERSSETRELRRHEPKERATGSGRDACDSSECGLPREPRRRARKEPAHRYAPIRSGNWRTWDIKPLVRRGDDGFSGRVHRLRALGNAVVPQQVYPILKAIADQIRGIA